MRGLFPGAEETSAGQTTVLGCLTSLHTLKKLKLCKLYSQTIKDLNQVSVTKISENLQTFENVVTYFKIALLKDDN